MVIQKTLTREEVLEAIAYMVTENMTGKDGDKASITVEYNEKGGVDIYIYYETNEQMLN